MKIILVRVTPRRVEVSVPGSYGKDFHPHSVTPQQAAQAEVLRRGWEGKIFPAEMPAYTLPGNGAMYAFVFVPWKH